MDRKAGIYARISLDRRDGEGVARQRADCRKLVAERGWVVLDEYVDNDLSAFRSKKRPEWDRLLEDLDAGRIDALVAYHPDRTYRRASDLESLIDVVERTGAEIATVKAGDVDLASATGRMGARIVAAVSRHESERIGERVSRAKADRATQGRPPGGGQRAFGWAEDKVTLVPSEAAALRSAALRVAAGGSVGQEVRELDRLGLLTPTGKRWDTGTLRRILCSPRIAGLRSYKGEIVGPAAWPAIIDEETWQRLRVMAEGRRRGRYASSKWLLSALIQCPKCGRNLYGNAGAYGCHQANKNACGGASITARHADAKVIDAIDAYLDDPRVALWLEQGSKPLDLGAEVAAIEQKRVDLARRWALDEIGLDAYDTARKVLDERLAALGETAPAAPSIDIAELRDAWASGSTPLRRNVIVALVKTPMRLLPSRMANPADRLIIEFREG